MKIVILILGEEKFDRDLGNCSDVDNYEFMFLKILIDEMLFKVCEG